MMRRLLTWIEYVIARVLTDGPRHTVLFSPARHDHIASLTAHLDGLTVTHGPAYLRKAADIVRPNHTLTALSLEGRADQSEVAAKINRNTRPSSRPDGLHVIDHKAARRWAGIEVTA